MPWWSLNFNWQFSGCSLYQSFPESWLVLACVGLRCLARGACVHLFLTLLSGIMFVGSLKSVLVGVFTRQKLANGTKQSGFFSSREPVVKHLLAITGFNISKWYNLGQVTILWPSFLMWKMKKIVIFLCCFF